MTSDPDLAAAEEDVLIGRVLAGDEAAFRALYRRYSTRLYRLALRMSGGRAASAEDVLQEAWSRAMHSLSELQRRSSLSSWLSAIVVRCALERIRWEQRDGQARAYAGISSVARSDSAEERVDLERAFEALPAGYRTILILHDVEGYTHGHIAALLGVSAGTSKSQLARARASIRRALGRGYVSE